MGLEMLLPSKAHWCEVECLVGLDFNVVRREFLEVLWHLLLISTTSAMLHLKSRQYKIVDDL